MTNEQRKRKERNLHRRQDRAAKAAIERTYQAGLRTRRAGDEKGFALPRADYSHVENSRAGHPLFHQLCEEESELHAKKNFDYTGGVTGVTLSPLANFNRVSTWMALYPGMKWASPEGVAMIYAMKQTDAAMMLLRDPSLKPNFQSAAERLKDDAIYKKIAICILHDKETLF